MGLSTQVAARFDKPSTLVEPNYCGVGCQTQTRQPGSLRPNNDPVQHHRAHTTSLSTRVHHDINDQRIHLVTDHPRHADHLSIGIHRNDPEL